MVKSPVFLALPLMAAGLLTKQGAQNWSGGDPAGLRRLLDFREEFRRVVLEIEAGRKSGDVQTLRKLTEPPITADLAARWA